MKKSTVYELTCCALMAAIICIFAPMSVPIGPIPVSLTNLVLYFAIFLLGTRGTTISYIVYLLLGLVGLPVFSGYVGGVAKVAGPTGGYLIGFLPMILIMGPLYALARKQSRIWINWAITVGGMILATAVAYVFGTIWFVLQMDCTVAYAMTVCVLPFIPFDLAKIVIANLLGRAVRRPLCKQGLIVR